MRLTDQALPRLQRLHGIGKARVSVLRLDDIHPLVSGNKWYKLRENLRQALKLKDPLIVTFGGAHSNHILATAAACSANNVRSAGIIRGGNVRDTPTLRMAASLGMELNFVSREEYGKKEDPIYHKILSDRFGVHHLVPEGGNNREGLSGCLGILDGLRSFDHVLCACGTGTTFSGLVCSSKPGQIVTGISVLKGENRLPAAVERSLWAYTGNIIPIGGNESVGKSHCITSDYAFSGYAGYDEELIRFRQKFENDHNIPLDHIYTVKLFYGFNDLLERGVFKKDSEVLLIHSGGLQGNEGFEKRYHLKLQR